MRRTVNGCAMRPMSLNMRWRNEQCEYNMPFGRQMVEWPFRAVQQDVPRRMHTQRGDENTFDYINDSFGNWIGRTTYIDMRVVGRDNYVFSLEKEGRQ